MESSNWAGTKSFNDPSINRLYVSLVSEVLSSRDEIEMVLEVSPAAKERD